MLCWGFGDFFIQRTVRKIGDVEALAFIGIIGSVILIPFILKDADLIFSLPNLLLLSVLGVITFIAALFNFEALKVGKLSVVDMILEFELPVTIVLSFIFFKEVLSGLQFLVIFFIFIGLLLMAVKSFSRKLSIKGIERGVLLGVIAAVGMGVINFLTGASSKTISPFLAVWFPWVIFTILCLVVIVKKKEFGKFVKHAGKFKWLILGMGIFDTLAWVFYAFAVVQNDIAITTAITESYPAIALLLGVWLNKERIRAHQYAGAAIALVCSFLLAFVI